MIDILLVLLGLQIKHCYADFVIQTYAQTVHKGIYRDPIGISHSVDHVWTSAVVLLVLSFFIPLQVAYIVPLVIAEGVVHYHIDWIKVHFGSKDNTKPQFWAQFGYDQLAHQATYLGMAYLLMC
jgi:hypothetical protein